jgi:L-threonylcarbamoyladenylate synthase
MNTDNESLIILMNGGIVVLPTDTVYGVVARVANKDSVARLYKLKKRDKKPGTIIASSVRQLIDLGVDEKYIAMVQHLWPNPISIVLPVGDDLEYLHLGVGSLAFRVVADRELAELLDMTGPLLTSSANDPGQPTANTIDEAKQYFGDKVDFYIDGGDLSDRLASTIAILIDGKINIIRQGKIKL